MVTDALRDAPKCLEYMAQLEDPKVFAFCAIPQVMAIATLSMCYDNGKVFEGVVKMRRGQTAVVWLLMPLHVLRTVANACLGSRLLMLSCLALGGSMQCSLIEYLSAECMLSRGGAD